MEMLRDKYDIPFRQLCMASQLPYPTFMRWRKRLAMQQPVLLPPGPKPLEAPDWDELFEDLAQLGHRRKRSFGAPALWHGKYRDAISRRDFARLVAYVRRELTRRDRADQIRVRWNVPGLAWALDPMEFPVDGTDRKVYIMTIRDMATGYAFAPIAGHTPCGEEIAGHLDRLFSEHRAPLFLKRDNGGNLNCPIVNEVLTRHWVIPLNSPVRYPQYNGAVEHTQGELKQTLSAKLRNRPPCPLEHMEAYAEATANELNHKHRRVLHGRTACELFHAAPRSATVTRRQRKEVTDQLISAATEVLESLDHVDGRVVQKVWRLVIEAWLAHNRAITLTRNNRSVTHFLEKTVS